PLTSLSLATPRSRVAALPAAHPGHPYPTPLPPGSPSPPAAPVAAAPMRGRGPAEGLPAGGRPGPGGRAPRAGLAARAAVGGAVHERLAADRRPAPLARLVLAPVGLEPALEVAALAVHVDVEAVEGGAALGQRLGEHRAHVSEQLGDLGRAQPRGGPRPVQPGAPQRLVGVDVADPADQGLVQQGPLDLGAPA